MLDSKGFTGSLGRAPAARRWISGVIAIASLGLLGAMPASAEPKSVESMAMAAAQDVAVETPDEATTQVETDDAASAQPAHRKGPELRTPKSPAPKRRGGLNPCMTPDEGFGIYDGWSRAPSVGQMIAPHKGGVTKKGGFDLIVHFHGHEAIRKEFVKTGGGVVLVGVDLGIGSGAYSSGFAAPNVFARLIESVEAEMSRRTGKKAYVRKLGLSAWSAGYGAIEQILRQPAGKKVDAVILLDSLHTGYVDEQARSLKESQLEPFVSFAKKAASKKTFMFMSHSSIIPPGYASTGEVATFMVHELSGKVKKSTRQDVLGLDMFERYDRGNFHMRGYDGNDKPDHCAHIGLMADVLKVHILPRWKTPRGKR